MLLNGEASLGFAIPGFILPALAGNVVGGTLIFSLLAHAQVHREIAEGDQIFRCLTPLIGGAQ